MSERGMTVDLQAPPVSIAARVVDTREVAEAFYLTRLSVGQGGAAVRPGQFVQLRPRPRDGLTPFLRIPLSVYAADPHEGTVDVLYEEVGPKTRALRHRRCGDEVGYLGPLGNAFPRPDCRSDAELLLVGGGIGIPPLLFLGRLLQGEGHRPRLLVGARSAARHLPDELVTAAAVAVERATDDGSLGHAGPVTDLLVAALAVPGSPPLVYTCGPKGMMATVARLCAGRRASCFASLEEYMACGFGVCVGCVVPLLEGQTVEGPYGQYSRVCVDGPVYDARRIDWEAH